MHRNQKKIPIEPNNLTNLHHNIYPCIRPKYNIHDYNPDKARYPVNFMKTKFIIQFIKILFKND